MSFLSRHRWNFATLALGSLSALGFEPLGWWPLTLAAFAAWMMLVSRAERLKTALARGYWFGVGHFCIGLNWIAGSFRYQDSMPVWLGWFAVVALALYIAVYPAMAAGLAWRWGRGRPAVFVLFFAAAWIVTEWLRATMFTGFAWNPLAVVLVDVGHVSRWIGTYGLSGLIVAGCGGLWMFAFKRIPIATVPFLAIGPLLYVVPGSLDAPKAGRPTALVRVVQPNIGQQDKYEPGYDAVNFAKLASLTGKPGRESRLIFWPEAAIPDYLEEQDSDARLARAKIAALMGPRDMLLTGGVKRHFKETRTGNWIETEIIGARNSVYGITPERRLVLRYDKAHLVPYGEYLPAKPILSLVGLTRLVPGTVDFWPGPGPRSFDVPGFGKAGFQICYEIVFSGEVVDRTDRPDFLFNPSNDAWFGSWGPPQHLAQARLRAIEEAMPVIRSTPTGISAVIDAQGRILASLPYQQPGFIETRLPPPAPPTLFARYGNILPFLFAIALAALGVALRRRTR